MGVPRSLDREARVVAGQSEGNIAIGWIEVVAFSRGERTLAASLRH